MTKDEALKQALDVLVEMSPSGPTGSDIWQKQMSAITTIANALAQPAQQEQTPYAYTLRDHAFNYRNAHTSEAHEMWEKLEQFVDCKTKAPQRTWVSLTDDQIKEIVGPWGDTPIKGYTRKLIDQIDAKLRENNNG